MVVALNLIQGLQVLTDEMLKQVQHDKVNDICL
ncbi:MAG: hypothetical protein H6R42_226 [Nitrospirae bacterium]|nr:hypothetical protein [Nitrospirota bacterium]